MKIFDYAKEHPEEILAVTDDGEEILYGELNNLSIELGKTTGHRLVFVLCRNTPGSFLGYLGLLESGGVPLLLDADIAPELLHELVRTYRPAFCLVPDNLDEQTLQACFGFSEDRHVPAENETAILTIRDYRLLRSAPEGKDPVLAPELRLLLTTSGSTGSSKLVRISGENLDANTASIIDYLKITKEDRPITVLPMQYSYGMSIINAHVMAGAKILLTRYTLMEKRFWERVKEEKCTSLCGVPYTFEMYNRLGLTKMDLPDLKTITQAGGKLSEKRHMQFAQWAAEKGIRFYVMYGQTEASPRMGWLPPERAIDKCGSMGIAIPGGKIDLVDEYGNRIPEQRTIMEASPAGTKSESDHKNDAVMSPVGEIVYRGPNIAMGYAVCAGDLAKGDEFKGVLYTGDMACRDADGFYYIVGRKSRFIKIGGRRIGLDEVEKILLAAFPDLELACAGKDDDLHVYVAFSPENKEKTEELTDRICYCLEEMTGIPNRRISVIRIDEIPRKNSGKIQYSALN